MGFYRDSKTERKIFLPNRLKVASILYELEHFLVIPITRKFNLRYHHFSEAHCCAKKAGMTTLDPMIVKETADNTSKKYKVVGNRTAIHIRGRVHPSKGNPCTQFMSKGTLMAITLHELAHLKVMNHERSFMHFLCTLFKYAHEDLGVFDSVRLGENEIPSPWTWENEIYTRNGSVKGGELEKLFLDCKEREKEAARLEKEKEEKEKAEAERIEKEKAAAEAAERLEKEKVEQKKKAGKEEKAKEEENVGK